MNANKTNLTKQMIVILAATVRMKWMGTWFVIMLKNKKNEIEISKILRKMSQNLVMLQRPSINYDFLGFAKKVRKAHK